MNLPGQSEENGYRWYAAQWISLEIEFVDFDFKTRFPAHTSLCIVGVKLKIDEVTHLNDAEKLDDCC